MIPQPIPHIEVKDPQTIIHLSADVDYLMGLPNTKLQKLFLSDENTRLQAFEIREFLQELKDSGVKCIPVGPEKCGNWNDQTGCMGHLKIVSNL